jgi:hypothetical protein
MSSPSTMRRARSSAGAFRAITVLAARGVFRGVAFCGAALRGAAFLGAAFRAIRALFTARALRTVFAAPALRALAARTAFLRETAFRAAGRVVLAALFFRAAALFVVLRPFFAPLPALRLAIAVVLSVVAYLDCFRVSVVKSSAYRRRKQLHTSSIQLPAIVSPL